MNERDRLVSEGLRGVTALEKFWTGLVILLLFLPATYFVFFPVADVVANVQPLKNTLFWNILKLVFTAMCLFGAYWLIYGLRSMVSPGTFLYRITHPYFRNRSRISIR